MTRILLAAGSLALQEIVASALQADPDLRLVGLARSGPETVRLARALSPDLVAMGAQLLDASGTDVIEEIMIEAPVPIVLIAHGSDDERANLALQALALGGLAVIPAPARPGAPVDDHSLRKFLSTLRAMAQVKVVRRWRVGSRPSPGLAPADRGPTCRVVGIVASTGGPAALQSILGGIPADFPAPILVVQHISSGFIEGLAASLDAKASIKVKLAVHDEPLRPGTVYLAPDGRQLGLSSRSRISVNDDPPVDGFRPSGTYLFESLADMFANRTLAVILTGMGNDGTKGLHAIRQAGGQTIAQDETSSAVFGMPKAAIEAGLVQQVLPLKGIARQIITMAGAHIPTNRSMR